MAATREEAAATFPGEVLDKALKQHMFVVLETICSEACRSTVLVQAEFIQQQHSKLYMAGGWGFPQVLNSLPTLFSAAL